MSAYVLIMLMLLTRPQMFRCGQCSLSKAREEELNSNKRGDPECSLPVSLLRVNNHLRRPQVVIADTELHVKHSLVYHWYSIFKMVFDSQPLSVQNIITGIIKLDNIYLPSTSEE